MAVHAAEIAQVTEVNLQGLQAVAAHGGEIGFKQQLDHFLKEPDKPLILALSRPDERKNILILIEVFGESDELQQKANLLIVAGTRDDISDLDKGAQTVFKNILLLIDNYDLYGRVAIPKSHNADDVPEIYRLATLSKGVFIYPALTEPFGLTILEAAASGLPVVATENGGPVDIISNCKCGTLVDPLDKQDITQALLSYLTDKSSWNRISQNGINGVRKHYAWRAHAENYLEIISKLEARYETLPEDRPLTKAIRYRDRAIFTDLDQNLIGNPAALQKLSEVILENRKCVSFGLATGRRIDSALAVMKKYGIPRPDILISSLGTRIHYGRNLTEDDFWADHIDHDWAPRRISRLLDNLPGLKRQPKSEQSPYKISYFYNADEAPSQQEIINLLRQEEVTANVILSFGQFLDVIPSRASKGQALRYVAQRLEIPLEHTLVAGGSGADEDMMRGNTLAVVVENRHHEELSQLDDVERIYFAGQPYASGIMEALEHYDFFDACRVPDA
jgi:sucrose-phosphate synthase